MFAEPTTISSVARLIGETLQDVYGIDPGVLFRDSRINRQKFGRPGSRVPFSKMDVLWKLATEAADDTEFGVKVGSRVTPGDFYVLGHAWLASQSLLGAFHRLVRYTHILSTALSALEIRDQGDTCALVEMPPDRSVTPQPAAMDAGVVALLRMCDFVTAAPVRPQRLVLPRALADRGVDYPAIVGCAVEFGDIETWEFRKSDVEAKLTGSIPEVAIAVESIADEYLASLDEGRVAQEVRQILIQTMPSGRSSQDTVARHLHRSRSTLQRQLVSEGTSYRQVLESTRQSLAEKYLRSKDFSQAEIAFMLGFTDQSNFARAFKRWTGMSPGEFRKAA
jgi:AraC-like DNA-binding protein